MTELETIGPETGTYAADVTRLARSLRRRPTFTVFTARATRLELYLALRVSGGEYLDPAGTSDEGEWCFVAVRDCGAAWFDLDTFLHPAYVAEKLNVARGDGEGIAEMLTRVGIALRETA